MVKVCQPGEEHQEQTQDQRGSEGRPLEGVSGGDLEAQAAAGQEGEGWKKEDGRRGRGGRKPGEGEN